MKRFLIMALFICTTVFAQRKQNIYFLKEDGREVGRKDSADFIRIIQEPDSGSANFYLLEYFLDSKPKLIGHVSKFEPSLIYEGQIMSFYDNGKKKDVIYYEDGKPLGIAYSFYKNGQLKEAIEHLTKGTNDKPDTQQRVLEYFDSTGTQLIKNGNGYYNHIDNQYAFEEGNYVNGFKNGLWKLKQDGYYVEMEYRNGIFISGVSTWPDKTKHNFSEIEELPDFKGGIAKFYSFVAGVFRYPQEDVKGVVFIAFTIEKDGSLTDFKVIKDLGFGTGEAAINALKKSPKWIPGMRNGIPVRIKYTLPIKLNL